MLNQCKCCAQRLLNTTLCQRAAPLAHFCRFGWKSFATSQCIVLPPLALALALARARAVQSMVVEGEHTMCAIWLRKLLTVVG